MRFEELDHAITAGTSLRHALTITVNCTDHTAIPPATGLGQACSSLANAPPMGARIHLKLTTAYINGLNLPDWKKVLLRTMSEYGAIINDTGSNNYFDWQFESGNQYSSVAGQDPWLPWAHGLSDQQAAWQAPPVHTNGAMTHFYPWNDTYGSGFKGLWNQQEDVDANVWTSDNLEVMDACVSDGSC